MTRRLALVFLAALAARAGLVLIMGPGRRAWTPDSVDYVDGARGLHRHGAFTRGDEPPLIPETLRTPGYPLLLSAFCRPETCPAEKPVLLAQSVLGAAAAALTALAAWLLFADPRAAAAAGLAMAFDPVSVLHSGLLVTETLFTTLIAGALALLAAAHADSRRRAVFAAAAGLVVGAAVLVRPAGVYLFAFAAAALAAAWSASRPWKSLGAFVLCALLLPTAWSLRNWRAAGRFTVSTIGGLNVAYMRGAAVEMQLGGGTFDEALARVKAKIEAAHGGRFSDEAEESAFAGPWAARFLLSHPFAYAAVMAKDAVKMLGGHGLEIFSWTVLGDPADDPMTLRAPSGKLSGTRDLLRRHPPLAAALLLNTLFLAGVYLLALRGAWVGGRAALLPGAMIAYFLAVSCGALAYYRFRLPLMPAVFVLAGLGWARLYK